MVLTKRLIERALRRVLEECSNNPILDNYTHIDVMTLNIERACQAAIDMALHIVAENHIGIPQSSADAFKLLLQKQIISERTAKTMVAMTGFRNIAAIN